MTQVYASDIIDLYHYAEEVRGLAQQLNPNDELSTQITKDAGSAGSFTHSYWASRAEYERALGAIIPSKQISFRETPEQMTAIAELMYDHSTEIDSLMRQYTEHQNALVRDSSDLESVARKVTLESRRRAKWSGILATCCFIIGSVLAIWGKWLEVQRPEQDAPNQRLQRTADAARWAQKR